LDWLNDGLPDLRSTTTQHFNLEAEFDIQQYLHILADSIEGTTEGSGVNYEKELRNETGRVSLKAAADSVAPEADEWSSWG
jgi:hypothetical protein